MLLQTLTTRLITATMSMQNWNMSEYVTIIHCPPFFLSEGAKRRFPSAKRVGEPPACRLSVAPLLNYHIFPQKATPIPTGTGALFDSFCVLLYNDVARKGRRGSTIYGRRLTLPHEGGDADVAESGASHLLDSGMYRVYALHIYHKSKIAAPDQGLRLSYF